MRNNPGSELEKYIAYQLKEIDSTARITRGSGNHSEIGDVQSKDYYVECKEKNTKLNIIMDYKKEYLKLMNEQPMNTLKESFIAIENSAGKKFIVMEADAFFRVIKKGYK
ncbi:MAG TPA: hypothetical protein VGB37_03485 [Candidatus Lokiarchaeia archaeon]